MQYNNSTVPFHKSRYKMI